jgi:hypothetical protein
MRLSLGLAVRSRRLRMGSCPRRGGSSVRLTAVRLSAWLTMRLPAAALSVGLCARTPTGRLWRALGMWCVLHMRSAAVAALLVLNSRAAIGVRRLLVLVLATTGVRDAILRAMGCPGALMHRRARGARRAIRSVGMYVSAMRFTTMHLSTACRTALTGMINAERAAAVFTRGVNWASSVSSAHHSTA